MEIGEEADEIIKKIGHCKNNIDLNNLKETYLINNSIDLNEFFIEQETRIAFGLFQNGSSTKNIDGSGSKGNELLGRKRKGDPTGFTKKLPTSPQHSEHHSVHSNTNKDLEESTPNEVIIIINYN